MYDHISGPKHRLDVAIAAGDSAAERSLPHGLVGQSFSTPGQRNGKRDGYPRSAGTVTTSAQAGAIEGSAAMYELPSPYTTGFAFSRFDAEEQVSNRDARRRLEPKVQAPVMLRWCQRWCLCRLG